ncbi:MAG: hypothetical protein QOH03_2586, partial [Kribbellaceae bacterium]|nr:hypothetical protein [Kribbellaceae bacterium]
MPEPYTLSGQGEGLMGTGVAPFVSEERMPPGWKRLVLKVLGAAVPVVTLGFGGWLLIGVLAIKRRNVLIGLSALGYLGMTGLYLFYVLESDDPELTNGQAFVSVGFLMANVLCVVQAAMVIGSRTYRRTKQHPYFLQPQQPPRDGHPQALGLAPEPLRRSQARQLAVEQPALARSLRIGRPDLPRDYDDGGLVDLNSVPAAWLATLPGITRQEADAIVLSRTQHGRF